MLGLLMYFAFQVPVLLGSADYTKLAPCKVIEQLYNYVEVV